MPRVVSFIVLLAIVLLIGSMFFQVMVQFIVPLFLAAVLVVIFKPLHLWVAEKCGHKVRLAAALTTLLIVLIVLLPILGMVARAVAEGAALFSENNGTAVSQQAPPRTSPPPVNEAPPTLAEEQEASADGQSPGEEEEEDTGTLIIDAESLRTVIDNLLPKVNRFLEGIHLPELKREDVQQYMEDNLDRIAAPLALGGVKALGSTIMGIAILVLTLYYFLADGPNMVAGLMKLSPLDDEYEQELLDKFADISRSVVVAVLLSAVAQGILAGIGYAFAGVHNVFFLTVATCFLAMVPFVGAAAVWAPVCVFLHYNGHTTSAIVLAVYCVVVVSMIDNLIKPLVLHGQANLHPLLALLSVIGGIQALGPIGILVGPMLVAFLQALLNMLNKELHLLGQESDETGKPVVFATSAGAVSSESEQSSDKESKPPTPLPKPAKKGRKRKK